ncbi:hypothetical protein [Chitinimonas taiwanensis]|uniref:hypothetical protein n=1 Tax=Chitinimonas taiwanensis TaxID=240412 RepID=UPI0035AED10E
MRHQHERAVVELCRDTQSASYTSQVYAWLQLNYPDSAARLKSELRDIYNSKRLSKTAMKA